MKRYVVFAAVIAMAFGPAIAAEAARPQGKGKVPLSGADLSVELVEPRPPETVTYGSVITWHLSVTNGGPDTATDVELRASYGYTYVFPEAGIHQVGLYYDIEDAMVVVSATPSQGSCNPLPHAWPGMGIIPVPPFGWPGFQMSIHASCDLGSLAPGASASVTIRLLPLTPGPAGGGVNVFSNSDDPNVSNNWVSASTYVRVT